MKIDGSYNIIYLTEQLKATQALLNDTPDFFYRKICRWYSKTFHTELTKVYTLPYHFVLQHYYEDQLSEKGFNEVYDYATTKLLKIFVDKEEDSAKAFAKSLLKEQEESVKRKEARDALKVKKPVKTNPEKNVKVPEIDLSFDDE